MPRMKWTNLDRRLTFIFFFKRKTAYEIRPSLVGSEMCIGDGSRTVELVCGTSCRRASGCPWMPAAELGIARKGEIAYCRQYETGHGGSQTARMARTRGDVCGRWVPTVQNHAAAQPRGVSPASHTHLTLPTICSP